MRLDSFWDAALASLAPAVVGYFISKTARFKRWRTARSAARNERKAMPSVLQEIKASVNNLTESDGRRTMQIVAIDEKLDSQTRQMNSQSAAIADVAAVAFGQMDQDPNPRFTCDSTGFNRMVNTAYARLLRAGRDELMEHRYRQFIPERLNPSYIDGFFEAASQHRTYETDVVFCRSDNTLCVARVRLVPHPEAPPATHWHGTVRYLREYEAP